MPNKNKAVREDRLVTRAEIAAMAGVARPTVTSWSRGHGFPGAERAGGGEYFRRSAVLEWLDGRPVPRGSRGPEEREGLTFGDRARRTLAVGDPEGGVVPGPADDGVGTDPLAARDRARVRELMGPLADRVRGAGSLVDYMALLLSLLFLRRLGGERWDGVEQGMAVGTGSDGARALLRRIGSVTDRSLALRGVVPGMEEAVRRLEPRTYEDLKRVVRQVPELGPHAFQAILDEYETSAQLRSGEFFTPRGVVRIMAGLTYSACHDEQPGSIYDPYARGGEMLVEAAAYCRSQGVAVRGLELHGYSHGHDTARLGNMNLALQGARPQVRLGRGAPWAAGDFQGTFYDYVLTNPPFNMNDSAGEPRSDGEWPYGSPPVGNDNFAYLQHAVKSLREGGTAAVVMPMKAGNSANGAEAAIRRSMLERGVVKCVLGLPDRLFSSTPVPVAVWFLSHPSQPNEDVLFLDARSLGTMRKGKRVLGEDDSRAVLEAYRSELGSEAAVRVEIDQGRAVLGARVSREAALRDPGCSLNPADHVRVARKDEASVESDLAEAWEEMERCAGALRPAALDASRPPAASSSREGWGTVTLSELCTVQAGPSFTLLRDARTPYGQVPLVFPKHLDQGRIGDIEGEAVSVAFAERLRKFSLRAGDIVCIRTGAIGPPALVGAREEGWMPSTNILRLRVLDPGRTDPHYLAHYLGRPESVAWVVDRATATGAPSISARSLGNQPVVLPPLDEQRRIAGELASLEERAAAHQRFAEAVSAARAALAERLMAPAPGQDTSSVGATPAPTSLRTEGPHS
ncbi:N-6 DNA methylase [Streptomyces sp. NPDC056202]|uniref:N-6 DNA methylase n=1 Tax=Streptomyces sp. NPDC056202 TaxID=3345745 RepID=UPI0035DE75AF